MAVAMGSMRCVRCVRVFQLLHRQFSFGNQFCHFCVLPLSISFLLVAQLTDHFALFCDIGVETQVANTVLKREDLRLSVQCQLQCFQIRRYDLQTVLQVCFAWVDQQLLIDSAGIFVENNITMIVAIVPVVLTALLALLILRPERQKKMNMFLIWHPTPEELERLAAERETDGDEDEEEFDEEE